MNKKDRKHSGRKHPSITIPKKELIKENIEIEPYWDDWNDYRDGFRNINKDKTKTIKGKQWNK